MCFWLPQELEQQFESERLSLEEHKTLLRQQLDELREELTSKLTAANEEVGETGFQRVSNSRVVRNRFTFKSVIVFLSDPALKTTN